MVVIGYSYSYSYLYGNKTAGGYSLMSSSLLLGGGAEEDGDNHRGSPNSERDRKGTTPTVLMLILE